MVTAQQKQRSSEPEPCGCVTHRLEPARDVSASNVLLAGAGSGRPRRVHWRESLL